MYRGEFLPELAGEEWVAIESCKYQKLYVDCVNEASALLRERQEYEELLELSAQACGIYFFEEYYLMQIDCLMALGRYKEAMEIYETAAAFYFEELGLEPSEEMLERFRQMREKIHYNASVITDIKQGLQENEEKNGAYFCSYPGFVDCYHIVCRMAERSGQPAFLMLCTLVDGEGMPLTEDARLDRYMDKPEKRDPLCTAQGRFLYPLRKQPVSRSSCGNQAGELRDYPEPCFQLLFKLWVQRKNIHPL